MGAVGRKVELRRQALDTLGDSIGEYVQAKDPKISPAQAKAVGQAIVRQAAQRVGGIDDVVNGEKGEAVALMVALSLGNETGVRIFDDANIAKANDLPARVLDQVSIASQKFNYLGAEALNEAKKA